MSYYEKVRGWFVDHPAETENPQTYWQHGAFAAWNSIKLIWAGLAGVAHAIFPPAFPFYTSTKVIQSFGKLVKSKRHKNELLREFGERSYIEYSDHYSLRIDKGD
jgi:hypothetical protein